MGDTFRYILRLGILETTAYARRPGWKRLLIRLRNRMFMPALWWPI